MNLYRRDCEKLFNSALQMLKEQTVLAVAEYVNDDYLTDRYKTVEIQIKSITKFYEASNPSYNMQYENDIDAIKSICRKLKYAKERDKKTDLDLLEKAVSLCYKVNLDVFSELQSAILDFPDGCLDDSLNERYERLLLSCDKLGIYSGCNGILSQGSIDFLLEYCSDCDTPYERVLDISKDLKDNIAIPDALCSRAVMELDKIVNSKIPF